MRDNILRLQILGRHVFSQVRLYLAIQLGCTGAYRDRRTIAAFGNANLRRRTALFLQCT